LLLTWQEAQDVGDGDVCVPVKVNPVTLWSNVAVFQLTVVWQVEQFAAENADPDAECAGLFVCFQVVKWQPEFPQSVGAIVKL
jgi:hypothetical protein